MTINIDYIDSIIDKVNYADTCNELATIQAEAISFFNDQMNALNAEMSKISPLLVPPSGSGNVGDQLNAIRNWIQTYINLLTAGYAQMTTQLAEYAAAMTNVTNSIISKMESLNCS